MRSVPVPVLRVWRWTAWFAGYTLARFDFLKPVHDMQYCREQLAFLKQTSQDRYTRLSGKYKLQRLLETCFQIEFLAAQDLVQEAR